MKKIKKIIEIKIIFSYIYSILIYINIILIIQIIQIFKFNIKINIIFKNI